MTDLEMTKRCAEAMRLAFRVYKGSCAATRGDYPQYQLADWNPHRWEAYDPLHNDEQAMALVKRFRIVQDWIIEGRGYWRAWYWNDLDTLSESDDLNRAIVACVAKMQANGLKP